MSVDADQLMAEQLAEKSIQRFGFVVCGYDPGTVARAIGVPTEYLWKIYKMPQPFVPIRKATETEWKNQRELVYEVFGRRPNGRSNEIPLVLTTD